jgi:hypothetical protein
LKDYGKSLKCDCEAATYGKRCAHIAAVEARLAAAQSTAIGALTTTRDYDDRMSLASEKAPFWFWRVA